ncbi:ABC transporter substrate-binding protein [Streptomyces sp. NPDC002851]
MPDRHRRSRRTVLAAFAALPLAGAVGACSGSGAAPSRHTRGGATRITFWSALRGSQEVVDAFNRTHDRIQVDFEQVPSGLQGGYAKLSNAARAGNAPDVATIEYPQVPEFAIDGIARDITGLVSDRLRAKLLPEALGLTTFEGRTYTVPLDIEPMVLHYRADLFRRYGLEVPATWDEFARTARAVRRKAPGRRLAYFPTDGGTQFSAWAWQAGARWFETRDGAWNVSLADAQTRKVAAYWQRLLDEDVLFAFAASGQEATARVGTGEVLARLSGAWDAGAHMNAQPGQKGRWRIAPMPQWDPQRPVVGTHGGSTFAVTRDSEYPEAAMEFIEWQVSHPDALRARLASGTSSQFPVVRELIAVGSKAFDRSYYGDQDIYRLFDEQARAIGRHWTWGPRMSATHALMDDGFARAGGGQGTVLDSVRAAQDGTMPDLKALGLTVTRRST